jgi:DNA-binding response OmpR family regulator
VRRLRAKLNAPGETRVLHTVRGVGYRMDDE